MERMLKARIDATRFPLVGVCSECTKDAVLDWSVLGFNLDVLWPGKRLFKGIGVFVEVD